jgi:hypothetical protein
MLLDRISIVENRELLDYGGRNTISSTCSKPRSDEPDVYNCYSRGGIDRVSPSQVLSASQGEWRETPDDESPSVIVEERVRQTGATDNAGKGATGDGASVDGAAIEVKGDGAPLDDERIEVKGDGAPLDDEGTEGNGDGHAKVGNNGSANDDGDKSTRAPVRRTCTKVACCVSMFWVRWVRQRDRNANLSYVGPVGFYFSSSGHIGTCGLERYFSVLHVCARTSARAPDATAARRHQIARTRRRMRRGTGALHLMHRQRARMI